MEGDPNTCITYIVFFDRGGVKPNVTNATFFLAAKTQLNKS